MPKVACYKIDVSHAARMVARTRRMIAIDQLAMFAMIHLDKPDTVLAGARHNWVCSLATPHWHESMQKFVMPNEESLPISVLHVTTPARMRPFAVPVVGGLAAERYLHRPGGRIMAALTGTDEQRPADPAPAVQPLDHLRPERRVEVADS